jgi:hypothetical protein
VAQTPTHAANIRFETVEVSSTGALIDAVRRALYRIRV